jgi:hypothetical protein
MWSFGDIDHQPEAGALHSHLPGGVSEHLLSYDEWIYLGPGALRESRRLRV